MTSRPSAVNESLRALANGCVTLARAPGIVLAVWLATLLAAVPFGLVLADRLRNALAHQPPISLAAEEIDADWWAEFRASASGLEATFTPAIIGFAAPLDNLSTLLDASPRPPIMILPVILYLALWAFLWGGVLARFAEPNGSPRAFMSSARQHFTKMLLVSLAAVTVAIVLYTTVHRLLFDVVFTTLAEWTSSDRDAFFVRLALYAVFAAMLALVSLIADYTRINVVVTQRLREAVRNAVRFLRARWRAALSLYLLTGFLFMSLFVVYGLADRRLAGWRAVIAGQVFVMGRLVIRLVGAASQVHLARAAAHGTPAPTGRP